MQIGRRANVAEYELVLGRMDFGDLRASWAQLQVKLMAAQIQSSKIAEDPAKSLGRFEELPKKSLRPVGKWE